MEQSPFQPEISPSPSSVKIRSSLISDKEIDNTRTQLRKYTDNSYYKQSDENVKQEEQHENLISQQQQQNNFLNHDQPQQQIQIKISLAEIPETDFHQEKLNTNFQQNQYQNGAIQDYPLLEEQTPQNNFFGLISKAIKKESHFAQYSNQKQVKKQENGSPLQKFRMQSILFKNILNSKSRDNITLNKYCQDKDIKQNQNDTFLSSKSNKNLQKLNNLITQQSLVQQRSQSNILNISQQPQQQFSNKLLNDFHKMISIQSKRFQSFQRSINQNRFNESIANNIDLLEQQEKGWIDSQQQKQVNTQQNANISLNKNQGSQYIRSKVQEIQLQKMYCNNNSNNKNTNQLSNNLQFQVKTQQQQKRMNSPIYQQQKFNQRPATQMPLSKEKYYYLKSPQGFSRDQLKDLNKDRMQTEIISCFDYTNYESNIQPQEPFNPQQKQQFKTNMLQSILQYSQYRKQSRKGHKSLNERKLI